MVQILQVIVVLFALFAISRAFLRFKDKKISGKEFAFWLILWMAAIVVILLPSTSFFFANLLGIQRGADFVVYISIILLFYMVFRLYVKIDSVEREITMLVRQIAVREGKKRK